MHTYFELVAEGDELVNEKYSHTSFSLFALLTFPVVVCPELTNPDNGQVDLSGMNIGSLANYSCNSGYNLTGSELRMCMADGSWSGQDPVCQSK